MTIFKKDGLFATPKDFKTVASNCAGYSTPAERAAAMVAFGTTFNLCAELTAHIPDIPKPPLSSIDDGKGKVIAWVPFTHKDDYKFLSYVLVEYKGKFVSWIANSQDKGFHEGHYTEIGQGVKLTEDRQDMLRSEALKEFGIRVSR